MEGKEEAEGVESGKARPGRGGGRGTGGIEEEAKRTTYPGKGVEKAMDVKQKPEGAKRKETGVKEEETDREDEVENHGRG